MLPNDTADALIQRRVVSGTAANYAGKLVAIGAWFFLTPFILHQLGPTSYGLWVLVGSIVAYALLLAAGIAGTITKYLAEHLSLPWRASSATRLNCWPKRS